MADIELVIKIPEELKNKIDNANEDNYRTYIWWFETTLYCAIKNGTPLEEELHREKEQAYYLGYEDGRKSEWTAVAESEDKE